MARIGDLAARFPLRDLEVRRHYDHDAEFRQICDDYDEALTALRRWQEAKDDVKTDEYRKLSAELEAEILAILDDPRGRRAHPDDS